MGHSEQNHNLDAVQHDKIPGCEPSQRWSPGPPSAYPNTSCSTVSPCTVLSFFLPTEPAVIFCCLKLSVRESCHLATFSLLPLDLLGSGLLLYNEVCSRSVAEAPVEALFLIILLAQFLATYPDLHQPLWLTRHEVTVKANMIQ